jgi:hypothetical protein
MLAVAIGLTALVWSCESEQTGYAVQIPLLGPTEFDQTSCEQSGDLCSVETEQTDCTDEDGFFGGPCTKTMVALRPITVPVSLSPSNPRYTLAFEDTAGWTNLFLGQQFSDGEVADQLRTVMTMDGFSLQGGPVTIAVRIFSRVGLIVGRNADYQPATPSSCTFTLGSGATGQDYANGINTCLSDWIAENGAPIEFDMEVTSSAGAVAKSEFVSKQLEEYMVEGSWGMMSENQCDFDGTDDVLEAVREGEGFFEQLRCEDLTLEGSGQTQQDIAIVGGAVVWDRCGNFSAALLRPTLLPGGDTVYRVTVEENAVEGDVPVVFFPAGLNFTASLLGAATGKCLSGTPIFPDGHGLAGWLHCGLTPPPPTREGYIKVEASGFCSVDQTSGAAGGSGQ